MRVNVAVKLLFGAFVLCLAGGALFLTPTETAVSGQELPHIQPNGGGPAPNLPRDEITDEQRAVIHQQIRESITRLRETGVLGPAVPGAVAFSWPVRKVSRLSDFDVDAISNYVDQNQAFPNQVLDWNCGGRTYDQLSGYNHKGTDIFTWPFSWKKMDGNDVEVVAGAPGTIVLKSDGNFDRSCGFNSNEWNAVYVLQADDSVAWYGHMKNGSVTTKPVGAAVAAGERLGVIGSSGNSTGPHLHFELYNASAQLQDPFQGPCNTLNTFTWWAAQEPYRVSRINALMTQSDAPVLPSCPAPETSNEKNVFRPGERIIAAAYYRDQLPGQVTQLSLLRPNGTALLSWNQISDDTYAASYSWWSLALPGISPRGAWKLRAVYNGTTYDRYFKVVNSIPFDYDGDRKADISVFRPSTGAWYLQRSTAGFSGISFGISTDRIAPADYDGDGTIDVAVYRPSTGVWYINNSSTGAVTYSVFGVAEDLPTPADHDGDGKADISVFRPSSGTWYRINSSDGSFTAVQFGASGDRPTVGDFDGDGQSDVAVFRPSTGAWYQLNSSNGSSFGEQFGVSTDKSVPADYDGDGKTDIGIYRPADGLWYVKNSSNLTYVPYVFGLATDIAAPADYDGDGKADLTVFRPSTGTWYIVNSSSGQFTVAQFGQNGDQPTPGSN